MYSPFKETKSWLSLLFLWCHEKKHVSIHSFYISLATPAKTPANRHNTGQDSQSEQDRGHLHKSALKIQYQSHLALRNKGKLGVKMVKKMVM